MSVMINANITIRLYYVQCKEYVDRQLFSLNNQIKGVYIMKKQLSLVLAVLMLCCSVFGSELTGFAAKDDMQTTK